MFIVFVSAQFVLMMSDVPHIDVHDINIQDVMSAIANDEIWGAVTGYVWCLEFQARSLPHAHLIITFARPSATLNRIWQPTRSFNV